MHIYVQTVFNLTLPEEKVWPGGTLPMLLPKLSFVCIPSFGLYLQGYVWLKYRFYLFILPTSMQEGMWPYRQCSPGGTDSKYVYKGS